MSHNFNDWGICTTCGETEDSAPSHCNEDHKQPTEGKEVFHDCDNCQALNTVYREGRKWRCSYCGKPWSNKYFSKG